MRAWLLLFSLLPGLALAEACIVRSQAERLDVKVCQENRNIPSSLFHEGFCQPQLKGQKVEVEFVEQCPQGAYGVCQNALAGNDLYQQDIHYYGVASDALFAAEVDQWHDRLAPLADHIPPRLPRAEVWERIEAELSRDTGSAEVVSLRRSLRRWQWAGGLSAAAAGRMPRSPPRYGFAPFVRPRVTSAHDHQPTALGGCRSRAKTAAPDPNPPRRDPIRTAATRVEQ